jgi:hypothetical protein
MANETIAIDVVARLDQLKAELNSIPGVGDKAAKALVANLERELKKANAAAKSTASSFDQLSTKTGKAVQTMGALGGVVGQINPDLGRAVTAAGSLSGVMSALSAAGITAAGVLGPVAVAIAAGAAAYAYLAREADAADAAVEKANAQLAVSQKAYDDWTGIVTAAADRYRVASHQITAAQLTQEHQIAEVEKAYKAEASAIYDSLSTDEAKLKAITALTRKKEGTIALIKASVILEKEDKDAKDAAAAAERAAADAARDQAEALEHLLDVEEDIDAQQAAANKAAAERLARGVQLVAHLKELETAGRNAAIANLDGIAQVEAARAAELADIKAKQAADLAIYGQNEAARAAIVEQYGAIRAATETKYDQIAADAAEESAARMQAAWLDVADTQASALGSLASMLATQAESMADTNREAAVGFFAASKAAAISEAIINTALGITQAMTLPPPADAIKATAVAALGAAQIATIAAEEPSFHAGGTMYPDERQARVLPGESVLNRQATAALGAGGVSAINRGGGVSAPVTLRIGRIEAAEISRTDLVSRGPISLAIGRAVAKGAGRAGRTGRGPIA